MGEIVFIVVMTLLFLITIAWYEVQLRSTTQQLNALLDSLEPEPFNLIDHSPRR